MWQQRVLVVLAVGGTLSIIHFVGDRRAASALLGAGWAFLFYRWSSSEAVLFAIASIVFLLQNFLSLSAGLFEFRFKDVLLQPLYEPLLWGFYFMAMKRFVDGRRRPDVRLEWKAVAGVLTSSTMFSLFTESHTLFLATLGSTAVLLALFHTRGDLAYAAFSLGLGLVVEIFGVSTGLWWYPAPDFLGIPYWFATMWVSVGLLTRRFAIPVSEWVATRLAGQRV